MIAPRAVRLAAGALLLLWLGTAAPASAAPAATTIDVTIQNFAFTPPVITVQKGDIVRWTNRDSVTHGPVSVYPGFIGNLLVENQSTEVTLNRPGTYAYVCAVHGLAMRGTVIVEGIPEPETPAPPELAGHIVVDTYAEPLPQRVADALTPSTPVLVAGLALAMFAMARLLSVLRRA